MTKAVTVRLTLKTQKQEDTHEETAISPTL